MKLVRVRHGPITPSKSYERFTRMTIYEHLWTFLKWDYHIYEGHIGWTVRNLPSLESKGLIRNADRNLTECYKGRMKRFLKGY